MADARLGAGARLALLALGAAALAWAVGAIAFVDAGADPPTTYAAELNMARVADIAAGLGLIVAGALAASQERSRRLGVLAMLIGVVWLGADWEGAADASAFLRSLGAMTAPFTLALVLHLALALPGGRLGSPAAGAVTGAAYAVAAAVSLGRALFRDPLLDLYCWRNCGENAFLVDADPGVASALGDFWLWTTVVIALGLVALALHRLTSASGPGRRALYPLLVPAVLVAASEAAYAVALIRTPLEDPARAGFTAIFLGRSLSLTLLALGLVWTYLRVLRTRARVARVAAELGDAPPPGRLRESLAAALGDAGIQVLYPRGESGRLIDAEGRPATLPADERVVTRIERGERTRAIVLRDRALADEPELERALGPAARLAVENEALRAESLAQLLDLRASRARIVATGDSERRRLERNLHDGAQQHLLALSYELRLAHAGATANGDEELAALLDTAGEDTAAALDELRELAHGIYPAILAEGGLAPALATLADAGAAARGARRCGAGAAADRRRNHDLRNGGRGDRGCGGPWGHVHRGRGPPRGPASRPPRRGRWSSAP